VQAACGGETDVMVTLAREQGDEYSCTTGLAPLEKIVGRERLLPESFFDTDSLMPTEEFRRYALPLVGPGLPRHFRL
jgi:6-phosphofructokinase 1